MQSQSRERGIGRFTSSLARSIIAQADAHDIHVILSEDLHEAFEATHAEFSALLPPGRVHSFGPYGPISEQTPDGSLRTPAAALLREAKIASLRPDIVHLGSLFEGFVDNAVVSVGRLRAEHTTSVLLHDLIPLVDPQRYLSDPTYRPFYFRHAQDLKRAELLLANSEHSRREAIDLLQIPPERIAVIFAGVDDRFRPTILDVDTKARLRHRLGTEDRFLFYVGAADPRKNPGLILEAVMLLPPELRADLSVVFAGNLSDWERDSILSAGRRVGLPEVKIVLLGMVDDADLIALYSMCTALVFPSSHEGFGLPPLEAMACGAPALAANATSLPEVVRAPRLPLRSLRCRIAGGAAGRAFDGRRLGHELRRWGPERAARFSWTAAGRRALDAFEAAVPVARKREPSRPSIQRRPRMAFISPLPPDASGHCRL